MTRALQGFWVTAAAAPAQVAIVEPDGSELTFGALLERVNRVSNALAGRGIAGGGHIALLSWNRADVLVVALAASQVGATFTPLNAHGAAPEIALILEDRAPQVLFVESKTEDVAALAIQIAGVAPEVVSFDESDTNTAMSQWCGGASTAAPEVRRAGIAMLYTSGTSGRPKGVLRQLRDVEPEEALGSFELLLTRFGIDPREHWNDGVQLVTSPLYHSAPLHLAMLGLHMGHVVIIMDRFAEERALELIERHRVTWTHVVPTMMKRWMRMEPATRSEYDVSSLKWFIHAAAPCPESLKREVIEWLGPIVFEYYASTEVGGTAISTPEWLARPGSVGRPWHGADVKILDGLGEPVPAGEVGMVYLRLTRPFVYHNDPQKTEESTKDGYFTAGDLGWLDGDGYLFIADRRSDLILVGGANVYPAEIEATLQAHPDVVDVAVTGIPHPDLGQVVHAHVQARPGADGDELISELQAMAERDLGSQKRPRSYELVDSIPRSEAGKLVRRNLRPVTLG